MTVAGICVAVTDSAVRPDVIQRVKITTVCLKIYIYIEGSRPEWCIPSMIYSRDTPFWLGILDIWPLLIKSDHWSTSWLSCLFDCFSVACGCRDRCGRNNLCHKSCICVWSLVCWSCFAPFCWPFLLLLFIYLFLFCFVICLTL